jgi:DNA-binding NarL/FixJ family response regulator
VIFAQALKVLLEQIYPVVSVVPDGQALIEAALKLKPDVVVADVAMSILNGLDAARRVKEQAAKIKLVLTMRDDPNLASAALELGRLGLFLNIPPERNCWKRLITFCTKDLI